MDEKNIANPFSRLSLYIILSGWIGFAVYVFIFFFGMEGQDSEMFLSHFLSPEENGLRFRALVFFSPFITTVIGFLVNEREKFFRHSMSAEQSYRDLFENANDAI
ncbi:MAG: hypothetical protein GWN86_10440, partial [Desulfobacterales bacterium]|nr:hypothetical protein [Desulfobacterales bacterium]